MNTNYLATSGNYAAPAIVAAGKTIAPGFLRFPGGTLADFYDWREQKIRPPIDLPRLRDKCVRGELDCWRKAGEDGFLTLTRSIGATPVFVLNLYRSGDSDQMMWVREVMNKLRGDEIVWELGNELNYFPWHRMLEWGRANMPDAGVYLARAGPVGRAVLQAYGGDTGLRVLANAEAPDDAFSAGWISDPAREEWNRAISARPDFYNGISEHVYIAHQPSMFSDESERMRWLFSAGDELPDSLRRWHQRFFAGKPLFLTEFGVTGDQANAQWGVVLGEISAVVQLLLERGPVEGVLKHLFCSRAGVRVVAVCSADAKVTLLPSGIVYGWINNAVRRSGRVAPLSFVGGDEGFLGELQYASRHYPTLVGMVLEESETRLDYLVLNRGGSPVPLAMPLGFSATTLTFAEAPTSDAAAPVQRTRQLSVGAPAELPPFSVTRIVLTKQG